MLRENLDETWEVALTFTHPLTGEVYSVIFDEISTMFFGETPGYSGHVLDLTVIAKGITIE